MSDVSGAPVKGLGERRAAHLVVALTLALFVGHWARSPMGPLHGDGFYTFLWARSLAFDGDLDLANDYALCGDPWRMARPEAPGLGVRNQWNPGPAVVWTPMLWLARLVHWNTEMPEPAASGCPGPLTDFALFGTVLMSLATLLLAYAMALRYVRPMAAALAVAGVGLASPLTYYGAYLLSYGHAPAAFGAALFVERWDAGRARDGFARWLLLGLLLGLAMLMRPQNALLVTLPLGEWLVRRTVELRGRDIRRAGLGVAKGFVFLAALLLAFSPQFIIWKAAYGTYFAAPQGPHYMRWAEPSLDGVFFASTGGLLVWTPLLYFSFIGLALAFRRTERRFVALVISLAVLAMTYVNASVWDFWGSIGFSNRRFTCLAVVFAFGMAIAFDAILDALERHPTRTAFGAVGAMVAMAFAWNFAAMEGVATGRIESWRERPMRIYFGQTATEGANLVHEAVGNPLAWPASLPFAVRYGVHPRRYDVMQGMSLYYAEYQDRAPREVELRARLSEPKREDYMVSGFARPEDRRRREFVTTDAAPRMLFPLFVPDLAQLELVWRAEGESPLWVTILFNGETLARHHLTPGEFRPERFAVPPGLAESGVNELRFELEDGRVFAIRELAVVPPD